MGESAVLDGRNCIKRHFVIQLLELELVLETKRTNKQKKKTDRYTDVEVEIDL